MENIIKIKVDKAISKLFELDQYLLTNDMNERTIVHKFAIYLQEQFCEYHVDCEYNKNIDEVNGSKNIYILKSELDKFRKQTNNEVKNNGEEYAMISIYPDIVIHRRGENKSNLLIIEIKKSTYRTDSDYDNKNLKCNTVKLDFNLLLYKLGI